MNALERFVKFGQHGTTISREVIAGPTAFTAMSYIVVVNPAILSKAGIPAGPSFVATVVAAVFGCALMSFTLNIAVGISAGFVLYPLCKLVAGKIRQIKPGLLCADGALSVVFYFLPLRVTL